MSWGLALANLAGGLGRGMQLEDERRRVLEERAQMKAAAELKDRLERERQTKLDQQGAEQTAFNNRLRLADQTRQMGAAGYTPYAQGMVNGAEQQQADGMRGSGLTGGFGGMMQAGAGAMEAVGAQRAKSLADAQGGFVKTAMSEQERAREDSQVERRELAETQRIQQAAMQRERIAAENQRAQEANTLRRDLAGMAANSRADGARTKADARSEALSVRLRSQYEQNPSVKQAYTIASQLQSVESAAARPDAAGDLSMIYAYMKILDPNSVVRETEFATAQNAANVPDRVRNLYNRAMQGTRLTTEQRKQFLNQARGIGQQARTQLQSQNQRYGKIATAAGVDPSLVIYDPFGELPEVNDKPAATAVPARRAGESWADYKKRTGVR